MSGQENKYQGLFAVVLTAMLICSIYWRVFELPFISDDWWYLRKFQILSNPELLRYFFDPHEKMVYRPLAEACMVLMYNLFGFDPVPMRVLGLLVHVANSYLVILILSNTTGNRVVGYLSGFVFASAIAIHQDLFAWAWAAYYDIGGAFFFFLSLWLYLKNKTGMSALFYFIGCIFKESVIFLPVLLIIHSVVLGEERYSIEWFKKWLPYLVYGGVVACLKIIGGGNPTSLGEDHPYAIAFMGKHLLENGSRYLTWMFQAVFPFFSPHLLVHRVIAGFSLLLFGAGSVVALFSYRRNDSVRRVVFLIVWLVFGVLPVYLLPNHSYRYYAVYSLPAFTALFYYAFHCLLSTLNVDRKFIFTVFALTGMFATVGSYQQSARIFEEGLEQNTLADGTNMLVRRATTVSIVSKQLHDDFPALAPDSLIVLKNVDLGAFGGDYSAIHYLYNEGTLSVHPPSDLVHVDGDWFVKTPGSDPLYVDPSRVIAYEMKGNDLILVGLSDLLDASGAP